MWDYSFSTVELVLVGSFILNLITFGYIKSSSETRKSALSILNNKTSMRIKWIGPDGSETMVYSLWALGKNKHKLLRRRQCRCWYDDQDMCLVILQKGRLGRG